MRGNWLVDGWLGFLGLLILTVYFRAVQTRWPLSYFAAVDLTGYRVSSSPLRYILFRLVPVVLVSFLIATLIIRANGNASRGLIVLLIGHVLLSLGRGLLSLIRDKYSFARRVQAMLHLVVACSVALAVVAGGLLARFSGLRNLVPNAENVASALWTAALAAIGGAAIIRATQGRAIDIERLVAESRQKLGSKLWEVTGQVATEEQADPALARAILVVENLQRPRWFRRLERIKGRLFRRGTYGVMQVGSEHPLTDEESVRIAVRTHLAGTGPLLLEEDSYETIKAKLRQYNPSPTFVDLAYATYLRLFEEEHPPTEGDDADEALFEIEEEEGSRKYLLAGAAGGAALGTAIMLIWALGKAIRRIGPANPK